MTIFYACHVTRERGYAPIPFPSPPRPLRSSDDAGCVNYNKHDGGRCRITGRPCDAMPVVAPPPTTTT